MSARVESAQGLCRQAPGAARSAGAGLIATEAARAGCQRRSLHEPRRRGNRSRTRVIDRETEARLAVSGCSSLVDAKPGSVVLFDIGAGGSSEIAVIRIGENRSSRLANTLPLDCAARGRRTLSERHGGEHVTPRVSSDGARGRGQLAGLRETPPSTRWQAAPMAAAYT
ncbi:hypothetical protein F2981_09710 [Sinorhizobium meliloti]|nr:hypothetical protein [Sinorhizobium meliloti]